MVTREFRKWRFEKHAECDHRNGFLKYIYLGISEWLFTGQFFWAEWTYFLVVEDSLI